MMGFPSVKKFLVELIRSSLEEMQAEPERFIPEIFETPWTEADRTEIKGYLNGLNIATSIDEREEGKKFLYVIPHFARLDMPFPQIGITTGNEATSDWVLGNDTGESEAIYDGEDITGYKIGQGCWSNGQWNVDILCSNPNQTEYLSVLLEYIFMTKLADFGAIGLLEVGISIADMQPNDQFIPVDVMGRRITVTGKLCKSWFKQISASTYNTGENKDL